MSCGIIKSLRNNTKNNRQWDSLVGYTVDQLRKHLEKRFKFGMTWENYGKWHIDHKIPISAFNFEKPEDIDFQRCWSLKNLQPMWAKENISKHDNLEKPFQPALILEFYPKCLNINAKSPTRLLNANAKATEQELVSMSRIPDRECYPDESPRRGCRIVGMAGQPENNNRQRPG